MSAKGIARSSDTVTGTCTQHDSPRAFTGTFTTFSNITFVDNLGAIRMGDIGDTSCGHVFEIVEGSSIFDELGVKISRLGDAGIVRGGGTCVISSASTNVDAL